MSTTGVIFAIAIELLYTVTREVY